MSKEKVKKEMWASNHLVKIKKKGLEGKGHARKNELFVHP